MGRFRKLYKPYMIRVSYVLIQVYLAWLETKNHVRTLEHRVQGTVLYWPLHVIY
jgi:hypothetical protein